MRTIRFNFNNEQGILELRQNDEGIITVPGQPDLPEFATIQEFAEFYAIARNVSADHLKNWVLHEDGDVYSFILRAAKAGITPQAIADQINEAIEAVRGTTHVLVVEAFRRRMLAATDVEEALIADPQPELAQAVYDKLVELEAFVEPEVDTRSDLEVMLDETLETVGTVVLYAKALNLPVTATVSQIVDAADLANMDIYDVEDAVAALVDSLALTTDTYNLIQLSALVAQAPVGVRNEDTVKKLVASATFAARDGINIRTIKFGNRYVKDTADYILLENLDTERIRTVNGSPIYFVFDEGLDAIMEAEIREARAQRAAELATLAEQRMDDSDSEDWDF